MSCLLVTRINDGLLHQTRAVAAPTNQKKIGAETFGETKPGEDDNEARKNARELGDVITSHAATMLLLHQYLIYTHFGREWVRTVFRVRRKCTMSLNPTLM